MKWLNQSVHTQSLVWNATDQEPKFEPPVTGKWGCGDGCGRLIPISTLSNNLSYLWLETGRVELMWMSWISVNILNLGAKCGYMGQAKFVPTHYSKIGCSDHFIDQIPISTLSNHLFYYSWEIGSIELVWNGWISLCTLNLGVKRKGPGAEIVTTRDSKVGVWWWLWRMNSSLNLV